MRLVDLLLLVQFTRECENISHADYSTFLQYLPTVLFLRTFGILNFTIANKT